MAFVFLRKDNIYFIYGETVIVSTSSQESTVLKNPELKVPIPEEKGDEEQESEVPEKKADEEQESKVPEKDGVDNNEDDLDGPTDAASQKNDQNKNVICCCLSKCGNTVAIADHAKRLIIWQHQADQEWHVTSNRTTKRKCMKLVFCESSQVVLAADRAGDVYSFSISDPQEPEKLLLGHLSMLLDMVISYDDKFIITSDRDEKIRVTHYPNTYNIQSYCLGHTEFVSAISLYGSCSNWLLSGSGDGTVRLWDYMSGKQLSCYSYKSDLQPFTDKLTTDEASKKIPAICQIEVNEELGLLAVLFDKVPCIGIFELNTSSDNPRLSCRQFVAHSVEPWDIELCDATNRLFILSPNEEEVLNVLCPSDSKSDITFQKLSNAETDPRDKLNTLLKLHWESIKDCKKEDNFRHLYKQWFDNMKSYLEKKEIRQQEKLNKSKKRKFLK